MNNVDWLRTFLFAHSRHTEAEGKPLYAYKCGDNKYEELKNLTKKMLKLELEGKPSLQFPPIFCLYAAETFCREHTEGPWAWKTIFGPLGTEHPTHSCLSQWIEKGLRWWNRELIKGRGGDREFLVTIACEGGLPLRLLQRENANLRRYFLEVLESYHRQGCGGIEVAETLARQEAYRLPAVLRQDVVFRLGGELIAKITDLQRQIGDTQNPIAALDSQVPEWRKQLPLRVEEKTAEALLNGLVRRSGELSRTAKNCLTWHGTLRKTALGWIVEKRLQLPDRLSGQQIKAWFSHDQQLVPRLRIMLHNHLGVDSVALLTLISGEGDSATYRREWLRRDGLCLSGADVAQVHRLTLHDGRTETEPMVHNGEPWSPIPWVFIQSSEPDTFQWAGEGSTRTRLDSAWVLVPQELVPESNSADLCESLGDIANLKRRLYLVMGDVYFVSQEGDRYQITCQSAEDQAGTFVVSGRTVHEVLNESPCYRGLPSVHQIDSDGKQVGAIGQLEWRSLHSKGPWQTSEPGCVGKVWLRLVDSASSAEYFRRSVEVLPRQFHIERSIGRAANSGVYRLTGLAGAAVSVQPQITRITVADDGAIIECPSSQGASLPVLTITLRWPLRQPMEIQLPYPQPGATFLLTGQPIAPDELVPIDRLGGLRLLIQDQIGSNRYVLDAQLIGGEADCTRLGFRYRLPRLEKGLMEQGLHAWQDQITSLLASSRDRESRVRLEIHGPSQEILTKVVIARFDVIMEPLFRERLVQITDESLNRLGSDGVNRVRIEMIRLWAPTDDPVTLRACTDRPACWEVPANLESGPWWVIGRDGDWSRFRPLLWSAERGSDPIPADSGPASELIAAIRERSPEARQLALANFLVTLGKNPDHPDWDRFFDYLRFSREFPPSTLDVLCRLPDYPATLAMALLKADDEIFDQVWSLAEQMPFSWSLIPINDWKWATTAYFEHLQGVFGNMDATKNIAWGLFQKFRERTSARRNYWQSLCDWIQERQFPERKLTNSDLKFARRAPAEVEKQIGAAEQELFGRHDAEERWPEGHEISTLISYLPEKQRFSNRLFRRPVLSAPFVVAYLCVNNIPSQETLVYELRQLRSFDPIWFDTAYTIALTLGLAAQPVETSK